MINVFYTYYGQRQMIPIIQAQGIEVTIIDDGSPEPLGKVEGCTVYRINEDIKWNIPGAKNLGFHVLDGWILHLPIDHIIDKATLDRLDTIDRDEDTVIYPGGLFPDGTPETILPHDMVLMHKSAFERIGGYDEDFAGYYGYEDGLFWEHCKANLKCIERYDIRIQWYPQGYTDNPDRDSSRNLEMYLQKDKTRMTTPKLRFTWKKES